MRRILCSMILLITVAQVSAQNISISPYSAFGYGDNRLSNGAASFGMGGLSTAYLSPYGTETNFMNPAANQNLRFTNFVFEGSTDMTRFKSESDKFSRSTTYLSKVSLGFPLGKKWRGGFGFQPFSALGYKTSTTQMYDDISTTSQFEGSGGLNSLHFMTSYNLNSNLALGVRANYIFGSLDKTEIFSASESQLLTAYDFDSKISGITVNGGISFAKKFDNNKLLTVGATYGLGSNIKADQNYLVKTYQIIPTNFVEFNVDTISFNDSDRKVRIPENASFGISYGKDLKWNIGAQVDWEKTSAFNLIDEKNTSNDRFKAAVGGYYIPQFNSYRSYMSRATYRGGMYYEKTPISVKGEDIKDYGITFGIGLPVGKATDASELNIGVELGQRGTTDKSLVKETYANVKLSFTLNDTWFQRRKYD